MFFEDEFYEDLFYAERVELSKYFDEKRVDDFYDNFIKDKSVKIFDKKNPFSFSFLNKKNSKTLLQRLKNSGVTHTLLFIPNSFISEIYKIKKQESNKINPTITKIKEDFFKDLESKFLKEKIGLSIKFFSDNSNRQHRRRGKDFNTKNIEKILDIEKILESLNGEGEEEKEINSNLTAYLFGFKGLKFSDKKTKNAISVDINGKIAVLNEGNSILIGNGEIFKFNIYSDSWIKITYDKNITIKTENIDYIESNCDTLNDYFENEIYDEFSFEYSCLNEEDAEIEFDNSLKIIFSSTIPSQIEDDSEDEIKKVRRDEKERNTPKKTIDTDSVNSDRIESSGYSTYIDYKKSFLLNIKSFTVPYSSTLDKVSFYLFYLNGKYILIGGSKIDPIHNPYAKVVANIESKTFTIENLTNSTIKFLLNNQKALFEPFIQDNSVKKSYINTDEIISSNKNTTESIEILPKSSKEFTTEIEFSDCAILFDSEGIRVKYINHTIGSFNTKIELNRLTYRYFGTGNIIDIKEDNEYGGRIYKDSSKKILGSLLSSNPFILSVRSDHIVATNSIKQGFDVLLKSSTINELLTYNQSVKISKDDFFSNDNAITILRKNKTIVEFSIVPN